MPPHQNQSAEPRCFSGATRDAAGAPTRRARRRRRYDRRWRPGAGSAFMGGFGIAGRLPHRARRNLPSRAAFRADFGAES
jgi:hypothetical protein